VRLGGYQIPWLTTYVVYATKRAPVVGDALQQSKIPLSQTISNRFVGDTVERLRGEVKAATIKTDEIPI
jgi:hypothetical protein